MTAMADGKKQPQSGSGPSVAHSVESKPRTNDIFTCENVTFAGLLLSNHVLEGLKSAGFDRPSPIQLKAIPLGRCGLGR